MPTSWRVNNEGSFASVSVQLSNNASIKTESDAVVSMSEGIEVGGHLQGGLFNSLFRSMLSNESFFTTRVEATTADPNRIGDVLIAPSNPGGICLHKIEGPQDAMMLTSSSYLACDDAVDVSTVMQRGVKNSLLSGTGFFLMRASGRGVLAISAYGSIHKFVLSPGEHRMVDNGHLVAWSANMDYRTEMASKSVWRSMSSGEGLMCNFTGPGIIYLQSHKPDDEDGHGAVVGGSGRRRRGGGGGGGATSSTNCICMLFGIGLVFIFCIIFCIVVLVNSGAMEKGFDLDGRFRDGEF